MKKNQTQSKNEIDLSSKIKEIAQLIGKEVEKREMNTTFFFSFG